MLQIQASSNLKLCFVGTIILRILSNYLLKSIFSALKGGKK